MVYYAPSFPKIHNVSMIANPGYTKVSRYAMRILRHDDPDGNTIVDEFGKAPWQVFQDLMAKRFEKQCRNAWETQNSLVMTSNKPRIEIYFNAYHKPVWVRALAGQTRYLEADPSGSSAIPVKLEHFRESPDGAVLWHVSEKYTNWKSRPCIKIPIYNRERKYR